MAKDFGQAHRHQFRFFWFRRNERRNRIQGVEQEMGVYLRAERAKFSGQHLMAELRFMTGPRHAILFVLEGLQPPADHHTDFPQKIEIHAQHHGLRALGGEGEKSTEFDVRR